MGLLDATYAALRLLFSADPELWGIVGVSLSVTLRAMLIAMPLGIGSGYLLATLRFPGRRALIVVIQGLLASPTVVVGLLLYLLLSRQGIFG
ncbi:MAG: ABC transporter permease, partial [Candidatus Accumulibacter sp.]|nr:ABC transporter permease [Accumulibacter sp.]